MCGVFVVCGMSLGVVCVCMCVSVWYVWYISVMCVCVWRMYMCAGVYGVSVCGIYVLCVCVCVWYIWCFYVYGVYVFAFTCVRVRVCMCVWSAPAKVQEQKSEDIGQSVLTFYQVIKQVLGTELGSSGLSHKRLYLLSQLARPWPCVCWS